MNDRFISGFLLPGNRQIVGKKNGLQKLFTFSVEQLPPELQRLWLATGNSWLPSLEFEADEDQGFPRACNIRLGPAMPQAPVWTHDRGTVTPVWLSTDGEMAIAPSTKHKNVKIWPVKPWPGADPFSEPSRTLWRCDLFFNIVDRSDTALYGRSSGPAMPITEDLPEAFLLYVEQSLLQRFELEMPLLSIDLETDGRVVFELGLVSSDGEVNELVRRPSRLEGRKLLLKHLQGRTAAGHNISEWDCLVVKRLFGVHQVADECWDTLIVEKNLCEEYKHPRKTFALNAPHQSGEDARTALLLARNQYIRKHSPSPVADRAWQESERFFIRRQPQWRTLFPHLEAAPEALEIEDWLRAQSQSPVVETADWLIGTRWAVPVPMHGTDPMLLPLGPHSHRQADYWRNLLPGLIATARGQRAILAVRGADRAQRLSDLLQRAKQGWNQEDKASPFPLTSFFVGQDKPEQGVSAFRRGVRRLVKKNVPGDLFLWPYDDLQEVQDALAEGLPEGLRLILAELPDLPVKEETTANDWTEGAMGGDADNETESSDEDEPDDEFRSPQSLPVASVQRNLFSDKPDGAYLTLIPLWLHRDCRSVSFACLDCRLSEVSDSWHTTRFSQEKFQWRSHVSHEDAKLCFPQPDPKELDYIDPATWSPWIEGNLIPEGKHLQDWQVAELRRVMPRSRVASGAIERSTGGGKSLIFQAAALYRGLEGGTRGLTVVVSPLRALMHDQVDKLHRRFALEVEKLTGDLSRWEMDAAYRRIRGGETLLLYVSPERFRTRRFRDALNARLSDGKTLIQAEYWVFDEAHCVSQWGLEFRPDYRRAAQFIGQHRAKAWGDGGIAPVLQVSATLTATAKKDFETFFGPSTLADTQAQVRAPRIPSHIDLNMWGDSRDLASIKQILLRDLEPAEGRAIIFINSRYLTQQGAELFNGDDDLRGKGLKTDYFHARRSAAERQAILEDFKNGDTSILFATKAFGMGVDIKNIRYVFHRRPPNSLEDFIQELGRAGRDQKPASAFLFHSPDSFGKNRENIFRSRLENQTIEDCRSKLADYRKGLSPDQQSNFLISEEFLARPSDTRKDLEKVVNRQSVLLYYLEQAGRLKVGDIESTHFEVHLGPMKGSSRSVDVRHLALLLGASDSKAALICVDDLRRELNAATNADAIVLLIRADQEQAVVLVNTVRARWTAWALQQTKSTGADLRSWLATGVELLRQIESDALMGTEDGALILRIFLVPPWLDDRDDKMKRRKEPGGEFEVRLAERKVRLFRWFTNIGGIRVLRQPNGDYRLWAFGSKWQRTLTASCEGAHQLLLFLQDRLPHAKDAEPLRLADLVREASAEYDMSGAERAIALLEIMGCIELTQKLQPEYVRLIPEETFDVPLSASDDTLRQFIEEQEQQRSWRLAALQALTEIPTAGRDDYLHAFFDAENAAQIRDVVYGALPEKPAKSELRDILEHAMLHKRFAGATGEQGHTPEQQRVVENAQTKSLLVNAGPGTGKTYTLLTCIAQRLMASDTIPTHHPDGMLPPEQVLVLAYTNAVVMELREKLSNLLSQLGRGKLYARLNIYTFHSFIRKVLTDDELKGDGTRKLAISKYVETFLNVAKKDSARFQTFRHIFVDEFQDVDDQQFKMLELLRTDRTLITAIGDPDQSIYDYDAARSLTAEEQFEKFIQIFGAAELRLTTNFRCDHAIVDKATAIFPRDLKARPNAETGTVIRRPTQSGRAEGLPDLVAMVEEAVAFAGTLASPRHAPSVAVLFRTNPELFEALDALKEKFPSCNIRVLAKKARVLDSREVVESMRLLELQPGIALNNLEAEASMVCDTLAARHPNWNANTLALLPDAAWHFVKNNSIQDDFQRSIVSEFSSWVQDGWPRNGDHLFAAARERQMEQGIVQQTEIVLSTVHRVKGLEYDAVVLASSEMDIRGDLNEGKRLYYVGITRARHWLGLLEGAHEEAILSPHARDRSDDIQYGKTHREQARFDSVEDGCGTLNLSEFSLPSLQREVFENIQEGDDLHLVFHTSQHGTEGFQIRHTSTDRPIGRVAEKKAIQLYQIFGRAMRLTGLKVVEVIHWTDLGDKDGDAEQKRNFEKTHLAARKNGYYYIVNVVGYVGVPIITR